MAVKSVFDIKCLNDVKFWVEQSVLHYNIFIPPPPPPAPVCQQKLWHVYVLPYFTRCMEVACWHTGGGGGGWGGERCSAAQKRVA